MSLFFFFNDTATTEIYTLSLHDALPICPLKQQQDRAFSLRCPPAVPPQQDHHADGGPLDRFSVFAFSVFAFPIRAQGIRRGRNAAARPSGNRGRRPASELAGPPIRPGGRRSLA